MSEMLAEQVRACLNSNEIKHHETEGNFQFHLNVRNSKLQTVKCHIRVMDNWSRQSSIRADNGRH